MIGLGKPNEEKTDDLQEEAKEFLKAIADKDSKAVAEAFRAMSDLCSNEENDSENKDEE